MCFELFPIEEQISGGLVRKRLITPLVAVDNYWLVAGDRGFDDELPASARRLGVRLGVGDRASYAVRHALPAVRTRPEPGEVNVDRHPLVDLDLR